ncbi:MAG: DUF1015 domain-containing protein [Terracidiphilus sp.]
MAKIYPFRAWRYNPSGVRLNEVVTLPCDRISPALQQAYYQRNSYNLVRVTLGLPELFDAEEGETVYTRAARDFRAWRTQEILVQENEPCVFAYSQHFTAPGATRLRERRGFIALGKLLHDSEQIVFPHEQASPASGTDRLALIRATRAQFDPILMLYSDPGGTIESLLFGSDTAADAEVTDGDGTVNRLWRISDPATIRLLIAAMDDRKLILADGSQPYAAALSYANERAAAVASEHSATELPHPDFPESAAMITFANMDSDGLVILPVHRVIHGLDSFDARAFAAAAESCFVVSALPDLSAPGYLSLLAKEQSTALIAITAAGSLLLRGRPEAVGAAALAGPPEHQRGLDPRSLNSIVLGRLLGISQETTHTHVRGLRDAVEVIDQVRSGEANVAFLANPVTMEEVREAAFSGSLMPAQSTDFYPALLSGLAIYALE